MSLVLPAEKAWLARLFLINLRFVECFRLDDCQGFGVSIKLLKEAAVVSRVAGSAGLLDLEEQYVAIAVRKPALNLLGMATGLALEPELGATNESLREVGALRGSSRRASGPDRTELRR